MILRYLLTVSTWIGLSRVLGFIRVMLLSLFYGTSAYSDMLIIAYRLPFALIEFASGGIINAAFIPGYGKLLEQDHARAKALARKFISWFLLVTLILTGLIEIEMPRILTVLAGKYAEQPELFSELVLIARIVFPYLILNLVVAVLAAILTTHRLFAVANCAPVILNLCLIAALVLLAERNPDNIRYLAICFPLAAVLQFVVVGYYCWRKNLLPQGLSLRPTPELLTLLRNSVPVMLTNVIAIAIVIVDTIVATALGIGNVSTLHFADRILQLPIAIIGIALYTVLVPAISRLGEHNYQRAETITAQGVTIGWLLALPCTVGMMILAEPIIAAIYQRGIFTAADSLRVAKALFIYAFGLPAFIMARPLIAFFHARQRLRIPLLAMFCGLLLHLLALAIFARSFGYLAIAIATAVASWSSNCILWSWLPAPLRRRCWQALPRTLVQVLPALVFIGLTGFGFNHFVAVAGNSLVSILLLASVILVCAGSYFIFIFFHPRLRKMF